jgi:hypothetical protein
LEKKEWGARESAKALIGDNRNKQNEVLIIRFKEGMKQRM